MNLPINTLLQGGKYRIVRFINSGGFGCTYEAEHVMLEKRVAIKEFFVKDFCNRDERTAHITIGTVSKKGLVDKLRRKFIDEAKGLCKLQHPGIVSVSDVFEENGTAYFVMDYIEGKSLSDIVSVVGALSEQRALRYIRQAAAALKYVHANNRLHLDIKPANIMIDSNDNAVLIDFGASKQYDEQDGENTSTLLGKTPGYAPLEQMGNDVVKFMPATDIYALGATLYKLLTGITPPSSNLLATGEYLPPLPGSISPSVCIAIDAAMQTRKDKRPQSVEAFLQLLDNSTTEVDNTIVADVVSDSKQEQQSGHQFNAKQKHPEKTKQQSKRNNSSKQDVSQPEPDKKTYLKWILGAVFIFVIGIIWMNFTDDEPVSGDDIEMVENKTFTNPRGKEYKYSGPVNQLGNPHGNGKAVYTSTSDGGTYEGEFINGIRNGKGDFTTTDGENHYSGTWKDDMYDEGKVVSNDGSYFKGTFKNNAPYNGAWYNKDGTLDIKCVNGNYE